MVVDRPLKANRRRSPLYDDYAQDMHNTRDYTISREKNTPFAADTHLHIGLPLLSFVMSPIP